MTEYLIYIVPAIILLIFIYLIITKQYNAVILSLGVIAVLFGFYFFFQVPEDGLRNSIGMLDEGYAAQIRLLKIKAYSLFFVGGLMVLLGLIFVAKKKN